MRIETTERQFRVLTAPTYLDPGKSVRLVNECSAIGDYEDSYDNPGSSYLWFGEEHRLDREEVATLIKVLQHWLDEKRLPEEEPFNSEAGQ